MTVKIVFSNSDDRSEKIIGTQRGMNLVELTMQSEDEQPPVVTWEVRRVSDGKTIRTMKTARERDQKWSQLTKLRPQ